MSDVQNGDWRGAVNAAVRRILSHPYGKVCKHWMLSVLLSELEAAGYPQPDKFVSAVVKADDETALSFADIFAEDQSG
jgi:hypothetical protein